MKDYCFIVSSAINSSHTAMRHNVYMDLYNPDIRFEQTVKTIVSINNKLECDIFVVESSVTPLSQEQLQILEISNVKVIQYSSDISKKVYSTVKKIGKLQNSIESLAMLYFLEAYKDILSNYKRIFKLSGRYELTNNFDLSKHNNKFVQNKFLFLYDKNSNVFQTRLYSVDSSLVDYHVKLTKRSLEYMTEIGNGSSQYVDMETCFRKFIDKQYYIQTRMIGVSGYMAHDGNYINE